MNRREFMQLSSVAAVLAADGYLPLLGADRRKKAPRRPKEKEATQGKGNIFTEPSAIEPVTGHLRRFTPVGNGSMKGDFSASYTLVQCLSSGNVSNNRASGRLAVSFKRDVCAAKEARQNRPANVVEIRLHCSGDLRTASEWTLKSTVAGAPDLSLMETGKWDGKAMTVKAKSWTQTRRTALPLIGQWALLGILAAGDRKDAPLRFDMLDNSTLRADQTLRYCGQVNVPVASGDVKLDCYAQTGRGILPIHYLVDDGGRVQLITQETVNWALTAIE